MSTYAIPSYYEEPAALAEPTGSDLIFIPRSRYQWVPFLFPLMLSAMSWMSGGIPALTDAAFLLFTIFCGIFVLVEFVRFPRRFGIGGLVLWGGVLCWFCQDYFTNWFHRDFTNPTLLGAGTDPVVIAKAACLHILFVMLMAVGLNIQAGKWAVKLLLCIPDPGDRRFYLYTLLGLFAFGISPYFFFCSDGFFLGVWHAATACWTRPPAMTVFRDGNLNYSWGAYVAQIMAVGNVSGIVAIIYTILIAPNIAGRLVGAAIWTFYALVAFQTGRRGEISFALLPPIAVLFIKYQAKAASTFKKFSFTSYLICGVLTMGLWVVVQIQGTFRGSGLNTADLAQLDVFKNQGNTMFSEGLLGYTLVPDKVPYFYANDFPGEGFLWAIPQTTMDFFLGFIPRALWHNKPVDKLWSWYNLAFTGIGNGVSGTTISHGLIGSWYFKYGMGGVLEGAILVGWLLGVSERALQNSDGQPIGVLMSLGFATWLFRTYRDFIFIDLYGLILGGIALFILVHLLKPILSGTTISGTG